MPPPSNHIAKLSPFSQQQVGAQQASAQAQAQQPTQPAPTAARNRRQRLRRQTEDTAKAREAYRAAADQLLREPAAVPQRRDPAQGGQVQVRGRHPQVGAEDHPGVRARAALGIAGGGRESNCRLPSLKQV